MIQETFPMIVGEEEVLNERELLVRVESGLMMDSTDMASCNTAPTAFVTKETLPNQ